MSQTDKLGEIIDQAVCEFGGIDILINNAGTMKPGGLEDQVALLILLLKIGNSSLTYKLKCIEKSRF